MLRASFRTIKQLITAVGLLLLIVLLAEVVLQFRSPPPTPTIASQVSGPLRDLLAPSAVVHHEMKRLSRYQSPGDIAFQTNSFGLRGDEPIQPKPEGVLRIVLLGDETILGADMQPENTIPNRLQNLLAKETGQQVEVLNAGVPGYSPLLSLLQFRQELNQLAAEVVILHFDMSDVADDAIYRRWLKESEGRQICLNPMLAPSPSSSNAALSRLQQSALLRLLQGKAGLTVDATSGPVVSLQQQYEWTTAGQADLRLQVRHALDPLQRLAAYAAQQPFLLLVSTSPVPWQVTGADEFPTIASALSTASAWPVDGDLPQRIVSAVCEQSAVPYCDATAAFRSFSQPEKLFESDSTSLSAYGNALYAREIASMLLQTPKFASLFSSSNQISAQPAVRQ
ncbi:SGNH/GDSL hydrolase family protein [Fuerstiella marisgermanici]|uniref:SGNH hydrolase-type esterase domain-containing protein n=1 Tax=Fuerstiella marisgermanici TaxID=1891926 RepID=A0A1P8WRI5_9PLAN|nr:SGNH/GDSL hydrolase family protein [Fuerstiella marisgermanici]APZ96670.1 hypothetical protein Fuma_06343 [Fuerstiella marisgermanici]